MKAGERGISKRQEGGQTIRMTVNCVCAEEGCDTEFAIDSRLPMRDQQKCEEHR